MGRIITTIWSDQGTGLPSSKHGASVVIAIGKRKIVKVPVASEHGTILSLFCKKVDGTDIDWDFDLVASKIPYGDETADPAWNAAANGTLEVYSVIARQVGVGSGVALDLRPTFSNELNAPFDNLDRKLTDANGNLDRRTNYHHLYAVISPNNALDETKWDLAVTSSD